MGNTGQPVQQVIQTKIDPKTGKPTQVTTTLPAAAGAPQVITVVDPKTGKPVQQMVQTVVDPKTGKTVQIPVPTPPGAQIVMVPDPVTGKPVPQMVQTVVDPKTGKQIQVPVSNQGQTTIDPKTGKAVQIPAGGQVITVTDPVTGQPVQQIVQTVIDPKTGKPTQVTTPLSNFTQSNGLQLGSTGLVQEDSISQLQLNGRAPTDVLESILSATMEEDDLGLTKIVLSIIAETTPNLAGPNIDDTLRAIRQGKVTDEEVNKLLAVFQTQGVVSSVGGVTRLRKISDIRNTLERANMSFDVAIENAQNAEAPQISDTNRKLMEDILRRSSENHSEMSSRVTALLAGSALTTKAGVRIERRDTVEQVDYTAVGDDLEPLKQTKYAPRRRKAQSEWQGPVSIHQANSDQLDYMAAGAGIKVQRRSIKRMSLARLRKTSEFSGLRQPGQGQPAQNGNGELEDGLDDVEEHRKIKGLKHSKVPMMVYSHGGFSRCFRIARRYQVDGPPIGVESFEDQENPDKPQAEAEAVNA